LAPILAFDFGGTKLDVALVGESHRIIGRVILDTDAAAGAEQAVGRAIAAGRELMAVHSVAKPAAIGVSSMGYTRADGVDLAPNVAGWESLRLPAIFTAAFPGVPCAIDNDVRAAAVAEAEWGALGAADPGVYLNLGTGVSAAILIGGRVIDGFHGAAGEIGYWLVPAPVPETGTSVRSGLSTLEEAVGGAGVRRWSGEGFAQMLESDSQHERRLAESVIEQIGVSVANLAIVIDPALIVLGGGFVRAGIRLLDPVRAALAEHVPFPPELVVGRFGADVGLFGAITLAERASRRIAGSA